MRAASNLYWILLAMVLVAASPHRPPNFAERGDLPPQNTTERPAFRGGVEVQTINVTVIDGKGVPVSGFGRADFQVTEEGEARDVAFLLDPVAAPLDLALLVDLSLSMQLAPWRTRTMAFLESLRADDCVLLLGFDDAISELAWVSPGDPRLPEYFDSSGNDGATRMYDALLVGIRELVERGGTAQGQWARIEYITQQMVEPSCAFEVNNAAGDSPERRRALVIITDGWDTLSEYGASDVLLSALKWKVPIFHIYTHRDRWADAESMNAPTAVRDRRIRVRVAQEHSLEKLTAPTGGRVIDQDAGYGKLLDLLRGNYVIGYYVPEAQTSSPGELTVHEIDVQVRRKDVRTIHSPLVYRTSANVEAARAGIVAGLNLVREGRFDDAVAVFDGAVAADPTDAAAYYERARALAALGRGEEALEDALRATNLDPGVPRLHELVARLALESEATEVALEHAIAAAQAGRNMQAYFERLASLGLAPIEWQGPLQAPRVVVRAVPSNDPDPLLDTALRSSVLLQLRRALLDSDRLAVVIDARSATHAVLVEASDLSEHLPRRLKAHLELVDAGGERVVERDLWFRDVDDGTAVLRDLRPFVEAIEARLATR